MLSDSVTVTWQINSPVNLVSYYRLNLVLLLFIIGLQFTDDRPSVLSLKEAKGRDGLDVIIAIAANDYRTFGMYLLRDENGQKIDFITKREGNMIQSVVEGIVAEWLKQEATLPILNRVPQEVRYGSIC